MIWMQYFVCRALISLSTRNVFSHPLSKSDVAKKKKKSDVAHLMPRDPRRQRSENK